MSSAYASKKLVFGVAYKGFNDTQSAWGNDRLIDQRCGQTWLTSLSAAGTEYSRSRQLPFIQVATWNDYNEGTPIETGISNCYGVTASVRGSTLTWSLTASSPYADPSTIARFLVFDSADGTHFHQVASLPAQRDSLSLASLGGGEHHLFVKMVGKADFLNQSSQVVAFTNQ